MSCPLYRIRPAEGFRNLVNRLKHVVLPAPFGPINAWILPRRTRRSTSRTAKNPANSFVNPWVSRMNSSANQISPISHRRDTPSRVANFSNRQVLPDVLEFVLDRPPPPGRNMPSTDRVTQGGKLGISGC